LPEQIISQVDNDTFLITSEKYNQGILEQARYDYKTKENFRSVYFNESNGLIKFTINDIDTLALNAQSDIKKIIQINNIIRFFINKNDILGKVYESIETNVNADITLTFPNYTEDEKEQFEISKQIIEDFNSKIDIERLIVDAIPMTYLEGNYIFYLRKDVKKSKYQIDYYPLGVVELADYSDGGEQNVLVNINELTNRLNKIYRKNRKNQPLFYKNVDDEIKATYPKEIYDAYINKEQYAVFNVANTGVLRINNLKRKYGLSPIFKSLKSIIRLDNIELSDDENTLVRGKKIIFQKLSKELISPEKTIQNLTWSDAQATAHRDLMLSLNSKGTSVYTGLPWTEDIKFVEPQLERTNVQVKNQIRNEIMTSVGISYLSVDKGSFGAAQISIAELMKLIDKISMQLEKILYKFYQGILMDNNIDIKYCPKIKVIDSEKLSTELSMQLARMLYSELNASLESVYSVLGYDIKTEALKRKNEKELGYDDTFTPRITAYTNTGKNGNDEETGRPESNDDLDRKEYDNDYNENVRT
jgi:hypothetical protein